MPPEKRSTGLEALVLGEDETVTRPDPKRERRQRKDRAREVVRDALARVGKIAGYLGAAGWAWSLGKLEEANAALALATKATRAVLADITTLREMTNEALGKDDEA